VGASSSTASTPRSTCRAGNFPLRDRRLTAEQAPKHPIQSHVYLFRESTRQYFLEDAKNPYVQDEPFLWIQGDHVGGRSLLWGRGCYRMSDLDFTANLRDGHGVDWPIRYADLAPWYAHVERFAGICGKAEGLAHFPDGEFQPPMEMNAGEKFVKAGLERAYPGPAAGARALRGAHAAHRGPGSPATTAAPASADAAPGSFFSSQASTLPGGQEDGQSDDAAAQPAHSVIYDEGRRRAPWESGFVDTTTGEMHEVRAACVFLCASALASTRSCSTASRRAIRKGWERTAGCSGATSWTTT
jgi:choline dehydrogenase-like flavoprotein